MVTRPADALDDLDDERPDEPFVVQAGGRVMVFRPAAGPGWRELMEALAWPPMFLDAFGPGDPDDVAALEELPLWQMRALLRGWRVHHGLSVSDADHVRLLGTLTRPAMRAAAERDLRHIHGLDLTVEWRARRWRRLLNLLDGLRRDSYLSEAIALDEELAKAYLDREDAEDEENRRPKRRMSEFSVEAELLSTLVDRVGELIQTVAVTRGAKRRRIEPMPRPETALHRVRHRRAHNKHKYTVARVFGFIDAQGKPTGETPPDGSTPPIP